VVDFDAMAHFLNDVYFPRVDWARISLAPKKSRFFMNSVDALSFTCSATGLTAEKSFDHIKSSIIKNVCFGGDPSLQYHLTSDASNTGIGGCLFQIIDTVPGTMPSTKSRQNERVVMFISQKLTPVESRYTTTEKEALAVVRNLQTCRHLVLGSPHPIKIYTDHSALIQIINSDDDCSHRIARWQAKLQEYDLQIHHVPGKSLVIADGLSRMPSLAMDEPVEVDELVAFAVDEMNVDESRVKFEDSEWYGDIVFYLRSMGFRDKGIPATTRRRIARHAARFKWDDVLYRKEKDGSLAVCVLKEEVGDVMVAAHEIHGHFSGPWTLRNLIGKYWWPTCAADCFQHTRTCDACQRIAPLRLHPDVRPILSLQPFDLVGIDYVGPITPAAGNGDKYVLIIVDYFSRFVLSKSYPGATSENALDLFQSRLVPCFGFPRAMYTDRGSHFTGGAFEEYLEKHKVDRIRASSAHPSSVGLAEKTVGMITKCIRAWTVEAGADDAMMKWHLLVDDAAWALNTRFHPALGYTPAQVLLGYNLRGPIQVTSTIRDRAISDVINNIRSGSDYTTEQWEYAVRLAHVDEVRRYALETLDDSQRRFIASHQNLRRYRTPEVGDLVVLRRYVIDMERGHKLEPRWSEPYLFVRKDKSGRSGWVARVGMPDVEVARCHIDHLRVYCPREERGEGL
jgi:transposase InsO family protein